MISVWPLGTSLSQNISPITTIRNKKPAPKIPHAQKHHQLNVSHLNIYFIKKIPRYSKFSKPCSIFLKKNTRGRNVNQSLNWERKGFKVRGNWGLINEQKDPRTVRKQVNLGFSKIGPVYSLVSWNDKITPYNEYLGWEWADFFFEQRHA